MMYPSRAARPKRPGFKWRCVFALLATTSLPATAPLLRAEDPPATAPTEVDAATKKLMAANGLFQRGLFQLAAQGYSEFLDQNPHHAQTTAARYALAICDYRLNDFAKASEQINLVLKDANFAQRDEALAVLCGCELSQKHYEQALAACDELLAKYPASKHAEVVSLNRMQALFNLHKLPETIAAAHKFADANPKSSQIATALYFEALAEHESKQDDAALQTAQKLTALGETPYRLDAMLLIGQVQVAENKLDDAIAEYRKLEGNAPESRKAEVQYFLGVALFRAGQFDEAIKELTPVAAGAGGAYQAPARLQLGMAQYQAHKIPEARKTLQDVVQQDAAHAPEAKYFMAHCDMAEKKFDAARKALAELLALQPPPVNPATLSLEKADCLMLMEKYAEAADELAVLRKQFPQSPELDQATYDQAYCLHQTKNYQGSHDLLSGLLANSKSPQAGAAAELDAENLFALGKYTDCAKAYAALPPAKDPTEQTLAALRLGQCAYYSGDYAKAVNLLAPIASETKALAAPATAAMAKQAIFLLGDAQLQQGKNHEAIDALSRYLASAGNEPQAIEARYKLGLAQMRDNDRDNAVKSFTTAAAGPLDSPWTQRALLQVGQAQYQAKQAQAAGESLKKLLSAKPPADLAAPASYLLAWIDFDAKKFPEAAAEWEAVAKTYPDQSVAADAQFQQGVALKEAGKLDQAATVLQAFAAAHGDSSNAAQARQLAADCLAKTGKGEEALKTLASLAADPKATDTLLYDFAWAQRNAKNDKAAQDTYRRLLKDHPDSKLAPAVRVELAELLYNDQKYDESLALIGQVKSDAGLDTKIKSAAEYRAAWCQDKLGHADQAADAFAAFAAAHRADQPALAASAFLQAGIDDTQQGKFNPAAKAFGDFLQFFPDDSQVPVAMLKLGEVQAELSDYEGSAKTFNAFIAKYPKSPFIGRAQFGIGWADENRKQYDPARQAYQKAVDADNTETAARAQFQIGETWLAEGKFEKAITALLAVDDVYAYPAWSSRALLEAGRAFEQLKQPDQAKQQYSQVVKKYAKSPEAQVAQDRLKAIGG